MTHKKPIASALLALSLLASPGTHAAPLTDTDTWYQIEVVIFERLAGQHTSDTEIWPRDITLDYPREWRKLIAPEKAAEIKAELLAEQDTAGSEANAAQGLPSRGDFPATARDIATNTADDPTPVSLGEQAPPGGEEPIPAPPVMQLDDGLELAFVPLPEAERSLNESAGAIQRDRSMRVLFHEAWRQPVSTAEDTPAIVVRGGNEYGEHTELEGAIGFSVSRYLHASPDIWLTQFMPNYGQESEHWPRLPPVPKRVPPSLPEEPLPLLGQTDANLSRDQSLWELGADVINNPYSSLIDQPFVVTEIVTLQQDRRMRSGELHYIDHPRLGILIYIEEFKPESDLAAPL